MNIDVTKCHGSGNDFLIIDEISNSYNFSETERKALAIALCDRSTQLGADGILFVMSSEHSDAKMRVFNADGSEASMCGNGLRCVARYVNELTGKDNMIIETMKANLYAKKTESIYDNIPTYRVEISPVIFMADKLPMYIGKETLVNEKIEELSSELNFTALAVPNPHLITLVSPEQIQSNEQERISEYVNGENPLFPDGVNVSFVHILEDRAIYVRTYERGVGFTNACGTAMSASSLVTCLLDINEIEKPIDVFNNGGKVRCIVHQHAEQHYTIDLIGNATYLYNASINVNVDRPQEFIIKSKHDLEEQELYKKLEEHSKEVVTKVFS
ncbi:diaminopimelate epimerase [Heyndrickxia acidicola]|uniref:Diaminopimelate epimerase n=1 Tax=Heyndrickxia acidicola TaxID=209389 RepID=A0ABU6ML38_9BACI|nr:diaminopimelate epimerase [Heyndrickxia acidicola]MED1205403.1 diaminopimelate epimerase [Heyndrickxia acidicola]